jgi:hypothetical protein
MSNGSALGELLGLAVGVAVVNEVLAPAVRRQLKKKKRKSASTLDLIEKEFQL